MNLSNDESNLKLKFDKTSIERLNDQNNANVEVHEYQQKIFENMSIFLTRYLDIEQDVIYHLILDSAVSWQENHSIPLKQFGLSLPQERLKMADEFKTAAIKVFGKHLHPDENHDNFIATMEHALLYYMKEFATR